MNSEEKLYRYSFYTSDNFITYGRTPWMEFSDNLLIKLMTVLSIKLPDNSKHWLLSAEKQFFATGVLRGTWYPMWRIRTKTKIYNGIYYLSTWYWKTNQNMTHINDPFSFQSVDFGVIFINFDNLMKILNFNISSQSSWHITLQHQNDKSRHQCVYTREQCVKRNAQIKWDFVYRTKTH